MVGRMLLWLTSGIVTNGAQVVIATRKALIPNTNKILLETDITGDTWKQQQEDIVQLHCKKKKEEEIFFKLTLTQNELQT